MRERLVLAFVSVSLLTLAAFGIVRAYALSDLIESSETVRAERSGDLVASLVAERQSHHEPVTVPFLRTLLGPDEWVRYVDPSGREVLAKAADYDAGSGQGVQASVDVRGGGSVAFGRS